MRAVLAAPTAQVGSSFSPTSHYPAVGPGPQPRAIHRNDDDPDKIGVEVLQMYSVSRASIQPPAFANTVWAQYPVVALVPNAKETRTTATRRQKAAD
jgi:hypothetical protein